MGGIRRFRKVLRGFEKFSENLYIDLRNINFNLHWLRFTHEPLYSILGPNKPCNDLSWSYLTWIDYIWIQNIHIQLELNLNEPLLDPKQTHCTLIDVIWAQDIPNQPKSILNEHRFDPGWACSIQIDPEWTHWFFFSLKGLRT